MTNKKIDHYSNFINRELSALQFNKRVLFQAKDTHVPLLERLRFLCICSSNLDEFFEIRVAGVKERLAMHAKKTGPDNMQPNEIYQAISQQAHEIVESLYKQYERLLKQLKKQNINFILQQSWSDKLRSWLGQYFDHEVLPIVSPIGLDLAHPFPRLVNKSLNFIVSLDGKDAFGRESFLAIVHAPRALSRVIKVPQNIIEDGENFVFLTSVIEAYSSRLFPGMKVTGCYQFRLTRNSDLFLDEEEVEDLAHALKIELLNRHYGNVVRLEISANCPKNIVDFLLKKHQLYPDDVYYCKGPVNLGRYINIPDLINREDLKYPLLTPSTPQRLQIKHDLFSEIKMNDILLHHPYQSFTTVVNFLRQASIDPDVLAIKQTLYRTHAESIMVKTLIEAARAGKEVTAVIELRARFDEESNLRLANRLQEAGVLVLYGILGYKTHAKMTLIVRREQKSLVNYCHLGTGNYHERTAKIYTDIGLLTQNKTITADVQKVFQQLTGMGKAILLKKIHHAPFSLHKLIHEKIGFEIEQATKGKPAHIIIKANGLTCPKIICSLYKASIAGVKIDLIIRTLCCLKPGIKGISDNISVKSVVGQFLEHSRVYYFYHSGEEHLYCSSADLMERNLYHRIEICFPIESPKIKKRVKEEALDNYLKDNKQSWYLKANGEYIKSKGRFSAQAWLLHKYS